MCEYVGREKYEISKVELDGMDDISVWFAVGVLVPVWQGKEGRYPSCHP